jgi:hypothetical protein
MIDYDLLGPEHREYVRKMFRESAYMNPDKRTPYQPHFSREYGQVSAPEKLKPKGPSEPEREFLERACAAKALNFLLEVQYQPSPPFRLEGNTDYEPDFFLETFKGIGIYVETKGRRMTSERLTRMKLRQCSERWPEYTWWLARWHPKLPWKVQVVEGGVIRRKAIVVEWLN